MGQYFWDTQYAKYAVWHCLGGYLNAAKGFKADDLNVQLDGKSYMITGDDFIYIEKICIFWIDI